MASYANGSVVYLAHRDVWVGYMHGRIVCTKKSADGVKQWFAFRTGTAAEVRTTTQKATVSFDINLRSELKDETIQVVEKANRLFRNLNMPVPTVGFFQKSTTAGLAYPTRHHVEFNEIIAKTNRVSFHNTVIHEVAHLIVSRLYPNAAQAHGPEFRRVMTIMGGSTKRTHDYNVDAVIAAKGQRLYIWACSCQQHKVTSRKHTNMMKRPGAYQCKMCKTAVKFVSAA